MPLRSSDTFSHSVIQFIDKVRPHAGHYVFLYVHVTLSLLHWRRMIVPLIGAPVCQSCPSRCSGHAPPSGALPTLIRMTSSRSLTRGDGRNPRCCSILKMMFWTPLSPFPPSSSAPPSLPSPSYGSKQPRPGLLCFEGCHARCASSMRVLVVCVPECASAADHNEVSLLNDIMDLFDVCDTSMHSVFFLTI